MKALLLLFVCGLLIFPTYAEEGEELNCVEAVTDSNNEPGPLDFEQASEAVAQWVVSNQSAPTKEQLAELLQRPVSELNSYFRARGTPTSIEKLIVKAHAERPDLFNKLREALFKKVAKFYKENFYPPTVEDIATLMEISEGQIALLYGDISNILDEALEASQNDRQIARRKVAQAYARACRIAGVLVREEELARELRIEPDQALALVGEGRLFESWLELKDMAKERHKAAFRLVFDTDQFDQARLDRLVEAIKTKPAIIVTTVVGGAPIHMGMFNTLKRICREKNGAIYVFPANMETTELPEILMNDPDVHVITHHIQLTRFLRLNRIPLLAKFMFPGQGLQHIGPRGQTQILGSPKFEVRAVSTGSSDISPHQTWATGSLNHPNYVGRRYVQRRTDEKAKHDHMLGAILLERSSAINPTTNMQGFGNYHMRHIEYMEKAGGIMDLNRWYTPTKSTNIRPEALVLGDAHIGDWDDTLSRSVREFIKRVRPKRIILHDVLNGHSISPHDNDRIMTLAKKASQGLLELDVELARVVAFINALMALDPKLKVVVVPSNHDFWLIRWLQSNGWARQPQNMKLASKFLYDYLWSDKDPLENALLHSGIEYPKRLIVLKEGQEYKVGTNRERRVELGLHGHQGSNGGGVSLNSMRAAQDAAVFGHTHKSERLNHAVNVGTLTRLILSYNKGGYSSWSQSMAVVGPNGEIQLLMYRDHEWHRPDGLRVRSADEFFEHGYPLVEPNQIGNSEGNVDQWGGRAVGERP